MHHADSAGHKNQSAQRGRDFRFFFATVYVNDHLLIRVQRSDDKTALMASASLVSDHVSLLGRGEQGVSPIVAPKKSTNWDSTIDAVRFTIKSHTE